MNDSFNMMRLWKHVESLHRTDQVAAGDKFLQITRKRCGIAGDVTNLLRL